MNSTLTNYSSSTSRYYQCQECDFIGKSESVLKLHVTLKHVMTEEKPIRCEFSGCNFRTTTQQYLRRHTAFHSDERPFVCDFPSCSFRTKRQSDLNQHKMRHDPDQDKLKVYSCTLCVFRCRYKQSLLDHLTIHTQDKPYACDFPGCDYRARLLEFLRDHRRTHDPDSMLKCDFPGCGYRTIYKSALRKHKPRHNPGRKRSHQCPLCPKTFAEKGPLKVHIRVIHTMEENAACKFCEKTYRSIRNLRRHTAEFHAAQCVGVNTIVKKYKCTACSFCSMHKGDVVRHQQRTHSNIRNFACDKCDYRAKTKENLLNHQRRCHGQPQVREFMCQLCTKRFLTDENLRAHMNTVHKAEKPFKCPKSKCEFATKYAANLRTHMNNTHLITSDESQASVAQPRAGRVVQRRTWTKKLSNSATPAGTQAESRFKCAFPGCSYSTNGEPNFRQHERLHRPELQNIQCPMCPIKFFTPGALRAHIRAVHAKERPLMCDECDYSTSTYWSIQRHKQSKHQGKAAPKPRIYSRGCKNLVPAEQLGVTQFYSCPFCQWAHDAYMAVVRHTVTHKTALVALERSCFVFV